MVVKPAPNLFAPRRGFYDVEKLHAQPAFAACLPVHFIPTNKKKKKVVWPFTMNCVISSYLVNHYLRHGPTRQMSFLL